jgi:hypothetical protein
VGGREKWVVVVEVEVFERQDTAAYCLAYDEESLDKAPDLDTLKKRMRWIYERLRAARQQYD